MSEESRLAVLVDGMPLPDDEARSLWTKFSEHMDFHKGDMAGFAKLHGYASAAPEARGGRAVLVVWTTEEARKSAQAASSAGAGGKAGAKGSKGPAPGQGSRQGARQGGGGGGKGGRRR